MNRATLGSHRFNNRLQSVLLMVSMGLLLGYIGWLLLGPPGTLSALLMVLTSYLFNSRLTPQLILRLHRAQPLRPAQAAGLYQLLSELSQRAGLDHCPSLYCTDDRVPNAFALGGHSNAAIVLSQGLLMRMPSAALLGVLGHELSHIRNHDLQLMNFADLIGRITGLFALVGLVLMVLCLPLILLSELQLNWPALLLLLIAPQICMLLQLALSRTREFEADLGSAELLGSPAPLIEALQLLDPPPNFWQRLWRPARQQHLPAEIRTHPSTKERITRLKALRIDSDWPPLSLQHPRLHPLDLQRPEQVQSRYWRLWP